MVIFMGFFRAIADLFKEKEKTPIAEGGDGELNLLDEQERVIYA